LLQRLQKYKSQRDSISSLRRCSRSVRSIIGRFVVGERSVTLVAAIGTFRVCRKKNPATQESHASDIDYIEGLEQQEASIEKRVEEVKSTAKKTGRMATTLAIRMKVPLPSILLANGSVG
jgi:hypothetical protein